ncbi:heavy-metal-associated domain-containing protein [Marinobacter sp. F4216]|uniref:heavy-metal-associated domain-containing protein n=1 Tax=Marinobacter sp. F4216 TaxID=2874281 RepID=UPI001CBFEE3A|nr:heavy-metal-associated domain-containing protein [Marinobacter sp. F4216]MBZ2169925.1 heavy-metal-associated domain-containing protein [Marinobacter sp. F4216]
MKTTLLILTLMGALVHIAAMPPKAHADETQSTAQSTTLRIDDMSTPACPALVEAAVANVPGVESVKASLDTKTAIVYYDASQSGPKDFMQAIRKDVGFHSEIQQ